VFLGLEFLVYDLKLLMLSGIYFLIPLQEELSQPSSFSLVEAKLLLVMSLHI